MYIEAEFLQRIECECKVFKGLNFKEAIFNFNEFLKRILAFALKEKNSFEHNSNRQKVFFSDASDIFGGRNRK